MLIKTLKASNFKKYEALEITDIPEKALIGIFGDNESGKSSIGDAVSFALFGQTSKFSGDSLSQLIHWDAEECEVELAFKVADDSIYRVVRFLDRKGSYKAILYGKDPKNAIETGIEKVNNAVEKLTCFNFQNFRYTFYMAQKEIDIFTQQAKSNVREVIHQMMGFDRFAEATKVILEKEKELKIRLEKCETELLHTRSDVKKIKTDQTTHKNLSTELEECRKSILELEESITVNKDNSSKRQEILEVYQQLQDTFNTLERSLRFQFHQESTQRSQLLLANISDLLSEEQKQLMKKLSEYKNTLQKLLEDQQQIEDIEKHLQKLTQVVDSHKQNLHNKVSVPEDSSAPLGSLQVAAQSEDKRTSIFAKLGTGAVIFSVVVGAFTLYSLLSAILVSMGKDALFFSWNRSSPLWMMFIAGIVVLVANAAGVLVFKKRLFESRQKSKSLKDEIAELEKELDICNSFDINNLSNLNTFSQSVKNDDIKQKISLIEKDFADLVEKKVYVKKCKQELEQQNQEQSEQKKQLEEQLAEINKLSERAKESLKNLDIPKTGQEQELDKLGDLEELAKKIEVAIDGIREHNASLVGFMPDEPPEMDSAWKEYEQKRASFRDLSGMTSIGGGKGMLNRIQMAFRQSSTEKLLITLNQEKDSFLSTLPKKENLEQEFSDVKHILEQEQTNIDKLKESLNVLEQNHQESTTELNKKKELVNKINALNSQIQNIERSMEVSKVAVTFLEDTIVSANKRFAPSLSRIMSRIMPRITKGRYQNVQATENLEIKAFSTEKNDFVNLSELSGGTVDQLFLSLRLAFSQAIMTARVGSSSRQFLFFDEPIISFDEQRSNSFLDLLLDYSENFVQVFLISPRSYEEINFDMIIRTELENKKLIINSDAQSEKHEESSKSETNPEREKKKKKKKKKKKDQTQIPDGDGDEDEVEDDLHYEPDVDY